MRLSRLSRIGPNNRGTLLVISLLIIIVLAGMGLVGVRNVVLESRQVGLFRTGEQSLHIAEAGMTSVLALAVDKGDAFPAFVEANQFKVSMTDIADPFFDTNTKGSFGFEYINLGGGTNVNFVSQFTQPIDTNRVPGFPINEQFVWKKYRITTNGYYGDQNVDISKPDDTLRNSNRSFVSYTYVGPYILGGGGQ